MKHAGHTHQAPAGPTGTADFAEAGMLIRWPRRYDLLVGAALGGRGRRVRSDIADAAGLRGGQWVLDVGCGTGTLALALAGRVGARGKVTGVDASPQMIAAARAKATRARSTATFEVATAQALPQSDASCDAVTTSLALHHIPAADQPRVMAEILRVLRPGGRLVVAEFQPPRGQVAQHLTEHLLGHAMAANSLADIVTLAREAGFQDVAHRATSVSWLGLVTATKPAAGEVADVAAAAE